MRYRKVFLVLLATVGVTTCAKITSAGATTTSNAWSPTLITQAGDSNTQFVLWTLDSCTLRRCIKLERTNDGGQHFTKISLPPVTQIKGEFESPISQVSFANPLDGYILEYPSNVRKWVTSTLFSTKNGGRSWQATQIAPHTEVLELAVSKNFFYALTADCSANNYKCSQFELNRSPVANEKWSKVLLPKELVPYAQGIQIAAYGTYVWLSTQNQISSPYSPYVATSRNEGRTFGVSEVPQLSSVGSCGIEATSKLNVWAVCDDGNMQGDIVTSTDGGVHWNVPKGQLSEFAFGAVDPLPSNAAYFVNLHYSNTLYEIQSPYATPRVAASMPTGYELIALSFVDRNHGLILGQGPGGSYPNILYHTDDAGKHWIKVDV